MALLDLKRSAAWVAEEAPLDRNSAAAGLGRVGAPTLDACLHQALVRLGHAAVVEWVYSSEL